MSLVSSYYHIKRRTDKFSDPCACRPRFHHPCGTPGRETRLFARQVVSRFLYPVAAKVTASNANYLIKDPSQQQVSCPLWSDVSKPNAEWDSKLTYVWEQYLFHYISEGGFTYLVMADDSAGRSVA